MPGLGDIGRPVDVVARRARAVVGPDRAGKARAEKVGVPALPRRPGKDPHRLDKAAVVAGARDPGEEGLPDGFGLRLVEAEATHADVEPVVAAEVDDVAPLRGRQPLSIKRHKTADQTAERGVGMGMDGRVHFARRRRQLVCSQGEPRDELHSAFVPTGTSTAPLPAVTVGPGAVWGHVYNAVTTKGAAWFRAAAA